MPQSDPLVRPVASPRGRKWGERAVVILLFSAVPALTLGYVLYQYAAERQDELTAGPPPAPAPRQKLPPPKWEPRDPPLLEAPARPPAGEGGLIAYVRPDDGGVRVVTAAAEFVAGIDGFDADYTASTIRLSRDRTRLAVIVHDRRKETVWIARGAEPLGGAPAGALGEVLVYDLARPGPPTARLSSDLRFYRVVWGTDADTLYVEYAVWDATLGRQTPRQLKYDLRTGQGGPTGLPDDHRVSDISADGKTLLVNHSFLEADRGWQVQGYLADADTLRLTRVAAANARLHRFSPDGKRVVGVRPRDTPSGLPGVLVVLNLADGRESAVPLGAETRDWPHALWSPDGTRLAVYRRIVLPGVGGDVGTMKDEVTLRNLDGSSPAQFPTPEGVYWFDWR